jgi:glycine dehydrogenase subunit 1
MTCYIPNTSKDREDMLAELGFKAIDDLFADIPQNVRLKRELDLPQGLSELELSSHMKQLSDKNKNLNENICFLGAGAYDHYIPSVTGQIISRREFLTSYTPYQPEISQGMLQAIFEYQTMICELTGMDVSNASMYDGGTALAEASSMAVHFTGRNEILVPVSVHPEYREILKTYALSNGSSIIEIGMKNGITDMDELEARLSSNTAAIIMQSPNFFGILEDLKVIPALAHTNGALAIACTDPISLGVLKSPGGYGFDIAAGEGQSLGNPLSFGGPYLGYLTVKKELMRKMPGRIVGQTVDKEGRRGFVLTLQAREQHIRREKAVSNICSNQTLNSLAAAVYLTIMGRQGLKKVAGLCMQKSHYAYEKLLASGKFEKVSDAPFFKEFTVKSLEPVCDINARLLENKITGGLGLEGFYPGMNNCWLVAVTEKRTKQEIDRMVEIAAGGKIYGTDF